MAHPPLPAYIPIPTSAHPIPAPSSSSSASSPSSPTVQTRPPPRQRLPSFPPTQPGPSTTSTTRKFTVPSSSALSSNVSDLLLSSLLPANLPKLPANVKGGGGGGAGGGGGGKVRELSSQREGLSLPLVSNNFRRFVTKVGPFFWLQDRVEEVLFWRKPLWTWTWLGVWTFISFRPRLLLLLPSLTLTLVLLHLRERSHPLPSLLGVSLPPSAETVRLDAKPDDAFTASTAEGEGVVPVVPPKEAESGVDYYMNLQAIQNLMGLVSDLYDNIAPRLAHLTSPTPSPTTFPISHQTLLLILLPPSLLLPLIPPSLIPYLLLPLGYLPPLFFHPNLTSTLLALPRHPTVLYVRSKLEDLVLTDALSDEAGRKDIARVEVWENERLDPGAKAGSLGGGYAGRFLRGGERGMWVKIRGERALWKEESEKGEMRSDGTGLRDGWDWVGGEGWRVDVNGLWSDVGTDEDGWCYTDDSWQNASPTPLTGSDETANTSGSTAAAALGLSGYPAMPLRRVTRRRRWYRRVCRDPPEGKDGP